MTNKKSETFADVMLWYMGILLCVIVFNVHIKELIPYKKYDYYFAHLNTYKKADSQIFIDNLFGPSECRFYKDGKTYSTCDYYKVCVENCDNKELK
jgi:hypothetical protein